MTKQILLPKQLVTILERTTKILSSKLFVALRKDWEKYNWAIKMDWKTIN